MAQRGVAVQRPLKHVLLAGAHVGETQAVVAQRGVAVQRPLKPDPRPLRDYGVLDGEAQRGVAVQRPLKLDAAGVVAVREDDGATRCGRSEAIETRSSCRCPRW